MADQSRLMQYMQMAQGSPYDEDSYMRMPVARRGGPPAAQGGGGSDMDMMMMYGPEDQVAYDPNGRPIPLADPRHPRNQQLRGAPQINQVPPFNPSMPGWQGQLPEYPQQNRLDKRAIARELMK